MARTQSLTKGFTLAAFGALAVACSPALAPQELKDARDAYEAAQQGPAGELAPAQLDTARQALERAESSFQDDAESQKTKDLSYVAHRKAILADTAGRTEEELRRKKRLEKEHDDLEKRRLNMTEAELAATRDRLDKERQRAAGAEAEVSETKKQAEAKLAEKDIALAEERERRKAAEGRLAAAMASLAEMGSVKEEARGVVITLSGSVLFATGKHELLPIAKEKLNDVAKALKDQGYKKIVVEGHTDSRGAENTNQALSLKRAESVRTHLISQGIDANKIEAKGLGESRPVASNDSAEGRANNRRVELIVNAE